MYTYLVRRLCGQIKKHYEKGEVSPMNNLKEQKLNNKGFSLVELIIVIAIMAVLIGVLAPQYIKYVERSRESADLDNYQTIINALQVNAADTDPSAVALTAGTITFAKNTVPVFATTNADTIMASQGADPTKMTMKSDKYGNAKLTITITDGVPGFTTDNSDLNSALGW